MQGDRTIDHNGYEEQSRQPKALLGSSGFQKPDCIAIENTCSLMSAIAIICFLEQGFSFFPAPHNHAHKAGSWPVFCKFVIGPHGDTRSDFYSRTGS